MSRPDEATLAQIRAADPTLSTWVSANAGSGKTRVLTDRVARLLLRGVPPQKVLCLTYTKAAAANMQNQLFTRLGRWAMQPDADLVKSLKQLGEDPQTLTADYLRMARTLFARALETPGGLKIQTIHSFCAALLRRFPLEAGVSPNFKEMDERSGRKIRETLLETLADGAHRDAFDGMARYLSGDDPDKLLQEISDHRDAFASDIEKEDVWRAFDLPADYDEQTYLDVVFPEWIGDVLPDLKAALLTGRPTDIANAGKLEAIDWRNPSLQTAETLEAIFVYSSDPKRKKPDTAKTDRFPTKDVREAYPDLIEATFALMHLFEAGKPRRQALAAAQKTLALHRFAAAFLPEYDRIKAQHGWLDFDDLILRARALLTDSAMAQWVLFRLDGGIDHILVDEAQDTSPEQWAVIKRLAEEFFSGEGARDTDRTLFVVGDEKQSIYSFQGADPAAFDRMRGHFETQLQGVSSALNRRELLYSFRSSSAILRFVDCALQDEDRFTLNSEVTHRAFHAELPGRVDLWPFVERPDPAPRPHWYDPVDMPLPDDPSLVLADRIATSIKAMIDSGESLPTQKGERPVVPGDFLILVQRRSDLFHGIIKALKDTGLPVAGADRLKIGGELAVRDLTALLSFMATPEDDLSLAAALRSPLFRLTEQDLFRLAHGRKGYLWQEIRKEKDTHPAVFDVLTDLLDQADFLRPYELIERILTRHKGREHLIARLGAEAEDGIDALLTQALEFERMEAPSLTGFLGWMASDESDIKRQMDTHSTEVRVMTVHGAKGLESPIVILPDTAKRNAPNAPEIVKIGSGLAAWAVSQTAAPLHLRQALEERKQFLEQERLRLFYVAMTRAENWLIICGAGTKGNTGESWYGLAELALDATGAADVSYQGRTIRRYEPLDWEQSALAAEPSVQKNPVVLPDWVKSPAPTTPSETDSISPSDLGGAMIVEGANDGLDEDAAKRRGRLIHALLEHLPGVPEGDWPGLAAQVLAASEDPPDDVEISGLLAIVTPVLNKPELAFLFGSDTLAEVPFTADLNGQPVFGFIDRLVIEPDRVIAVDFKSNADVPAKPEQTPEGILRQMGAYALALGQIYPDRAVETAILWTATANLMPLSHKIVTDALGRAPTS